jgi:dienelactone hydrolase
MVAGIDRDLMRRIEHAQQVRAFRWMRDINSVPDYLNSIAPHRQRLAQILGLTDTRLAPNLQQFGEYSPTHPSITSNPALVAVGNNYRVYQVRWPVLDGVNGEGLMLVPNRPPTGRVVLLPDADQTPEQMIGLQPATPATPTTPSLSDDSQLARHLAHSGALVVIPQLVNRDIAYSGNPKLASTDIRKGNMPHREWLYRMAYQMGRHVIGYEVQKTLALLDWFDSIDAQSNDTLGDISVVGYGEGGLIALYTAAVDQRVDICITSGYFANRNRVWEEPIYRNVWSLLTDFGDAELAGLILPRKLYIEHAHAPDVQGPPTAPKGVRAVAAPGQITTPTYDDIRAEYQRFAEGLPTEVLPESPIITGPDHAPVALFSGVTRGLRDAGFLQIDPSPPLTDRRENFDPEARQKRAVKEIENHVQYLLRTANHTRDAFFLDKTPFNKTAAEFEAAAEEYRRIFHEDVIGKLHDPLLPFNARTRQVYDEPTWTGHDVVLDVMPDVSAWGVLMLPKDLKPGEKRPVVVCQHGLEGVPAQVIDRDSEKESAYHAFATQLVERGFIVYAPHNPYRGRDAFRVLQRKANPLGLSLFSYIIKQHRQTLDWLKTQPNVDPDRIGFYGLSYGGKTAMRVPAVLTDYKLSICSGDFNEWIWKNVTTDWRSSYMYTIEYEMPEFNLGQTFNYAEMAYLIFPRPFMVERGHRDGVALTEWVAFEFAKVRRLYDELGLTNNARIEYFPGRHEINGVGTFDFLHEHLDWPKR